MAEEIKKDNDRIKNKKFVFGEYQSLIGVYKVHGNNFRANRK
jgi:hypothetical protein